MITLYRSDARPNLPTDYASRDSLINEPRETHRASIGIFFGVVFGLIGWAGLIHAALKVITNA